VDFQITPLPGSSPALQAWLASYGSGLDQARFEIHLTIAGAKTDSSEAYVVGSFDRHEPTGNPTAFLSKLIAAHGSDTVAASVHSFRSLPFTGAIVGLALSRATGIAEVGGQFGNHPPGGWMVTRLVIEPRPPEFYRSRGRVKPQPLQILLAINSQLGQGALIPVDSVYAPLAFSLFAGLMYDVTTH